MVETSDVHLRYVHLRYVTFLLTPFWHGHKGVPRTPESEGEILEGEVDPRSEETHDRSKEPSTGEADEPVQTREAAEIDDDRHTTTVPVPRHVQQSVHFLRVCLKELPEN